MLREAEGNLLEATVDALVNTVNTVGVMGKGIALQFKQAYPENFRAYKAACRRGEVQIGRMFVVETGLLGQPRWIINFPTKQHWRSRSRIDDIKSGLADLRRVLQEVHARSVVVPALGCGNGGLDWCEVRPLIVEALGDIPDVEVIVYPPTGAPPPGLRLPACHGALFDAHVPSSRNLGSIWPSLGQGPRSAAGITAIPSGRR